MSKKLMTWMAAGMMAGMISASAATEEKKAEPAKAPEKTAADAAKPAANPKDVQDKLLKLTTLEGAFKNALRVRTQLATVVVSAAEKVKAAKTDADKAAAKKLFDEASKELQTIKGAMELIFTPGPIRDYEYDEVKSTIYLKVGSEEEVFGRAIKMRDLLDASIGKQTKLMEGEKDAAKKAELQKNLDMMKRQHQAMLVALQIIYGITPQRNYTYDPKTETLYVKVSQAEVDKLNEQIKKLQDEQKAKADKNAVPVKDEKKADGKKS